MGSPQITVPKKLTPSQVRDAIQAICAEHNYNPFEELIKIATETSEVEIGGQMVRVATADVDQRITIAKELASYMAPKLKSVEVEGKIQQDFTLKVVHFHENGREIEVQLPQRVELANGDN